MKKEHSPQIGAGKPQIDESAAVEDSLPPLFGRDRLKRIVTVYSLLWFFSYKTLYRANFGAIGRTFKPLLNSLTEWQIAALMIMHFNWHGADGRDEFVFKRLESAMHPILWIPAKVNEYGTYLTNVAGVDFEDKEKVRAYVRMEMKNAVLEGLHAGIIQNVDTNNRRKD